MKLKNKEIIAAIDNFENLNKAGLKLPGRVGFTIKQNKKKLLAEYRDYLEELNGIDAEKDSQEWKDTTNELLEAESEVAIAKVSPELLFDQDYEPILFDILDFMLEEVPEVNSAE